MDNFQFIFVPKLTMKEVLWRIKWHGQGRHWKKDGDKREETAQANRLSIQNETFFGRNIKIKYFYFFFNLPMKSWQLEQLEWMIAPNGSQFAYSNGFRLQGRRIYLLFITKIINGHWTICGTSSIWMLHYGVHICAITIFRC